MSIDLPQDGYCVAVERSAWWSTVTMCPYFSMGRTHSIFLATSAGLIWLSPSPFSSSTITFKQEYISLAFSLGSISNVLSLFMTIWKRSSRSLLDPSWSAQSSVQSSWAVLWFRTRLNTFLQRLLKMWFLAFAFHFSFSCSIGVRVAFLARGVNLQSRLLGTWHHKLWGMTPSVFSNTESHHHRT